VQELRVLGAGNKFVGGRTLSVAGAAQLDGGGLTLDVPLRVGEAMFLLNGSTLTHTANTSEDVREINLTVAGNLTVDASSQISAVAKGYALAKAYQGAKNGNEVAHGGRPRSPVNTVCYGSVLRPCTSGSSTESYGLGGGRVRLTVGGVATIDGRVSANGYEANGVTDVGGIGWLSAAGGSVLMTAGSLRGSGKISANAGTATNGPDGGGGRVAVYLTGSSDFETFTSAGGVISAYGSRLIGAGNYPQSSCGTVYLQGTDGEKRLILDNDGGDRNCYTDFPVPVERGGDNPKLFRDVTVVLRNLGAVNLVGDVSVKEVEVETANTIRPSFFLNDHVLSIYSRAHRKGKGWATWSANAGTEGKGKIVWPIGLSVIVK